MTCSRCHEPMMDAECVDPDETGLMGMKGWRCEGCGDDHTPRHRHTLFPAPGRVPGVYDCPRRGRRRRAAGMGSLHGTTHLTL